MNDKISRRLFAGSSVAAFGLSGLAFADIPHSTTEFTKIDEPDVYWFTMSGRDRHFGRYSAFGEMSASNGAGVVVLTAANGDQIVGVVNAAAEAGDRTQGHFHFSWRDSVSVGGRVYTNTGRFAKHRPPGLVVVSVIRVLIGLLLPVLES